MASNINENNIDATYPIAGQDNDSQGFRTNFTNIKNNLGFAKDEIEDLQGKAILKGALSGTSLDNDMGGAAFSGALISDLREVRVDFGVTNGTLSLNHNDAHNYTVTTNGSVTLSFTGFPAAGQVGRILFEVTVADVGHTVTMPSAIDKGTAGIAGLSDAGVLTFGAIGTYQFEFWSDDGGTSIHVNDLSRNRDTFDSTEITIIQRTPANSGSAGDVPGMIALDNDYVYICTGTYDGSTAIWKRAAFGIY